MLKKSKKVIIFDMTNEIRRVIEEVFYIVDQTLGTQYYNIFYQVYLNQVKMSIDQIAALCNLSHHGFLNNMEMVNKFISNILLYCENKFMYI